ncbi:hypothetical protein BROUX41_006343 [Berkeleyomyces rouxiae]
MDGLSGVASVIQVLTSAVDFSSTLFEYVKDVKNAPDTIRRLHGQVKSLQKAGKQINDSLESPNATKPRRKDSLNESLEKSRSELQSLYNQLETKWTEKLKNKWRFKSLKRLFERKYTERKIEELEKLRHDIARALQVDDV